MYLFKKALIALSHIYVSAAYQWRIYENFDMPRSEAIFSKQCMFHVPARFLWHISDVSAFWNFTFVLYVQRFKANSIGYVLMMYVWRMTYLRRMYYVPFLTVAYLFENK